MNQTKITRLIDDYATNHFTTLVQGKKVIIVGPDTALKGRGLGKYIDSFDLVIRHNTVFDFLPFKGQYAKDYGKRTDILYLSPTCMKTYANSNDLAKMKKLGIKFLVYQNGNRNNLYLTGEYCFPKPLAFFKKNAPKKGIELHYSHHTANGLTQMMCDLVEADKKIVPRTGFISIFDMIVHKAKQVKIVGMSFYHGGGHAFRPDTKGELNPLADHKGKDSPHDSKIELDLMLTFIENYPQIDLDMSFMKDQVDQVDQSKVAEDQDGDDSSTSGEYAELMEVKTEYTDTGTEHTEDLSGSCNSVPYDNSFATSSESD